MDANDKSKICELERGVLRFMCSGVDDASMTDARRELATYNWQDDDNRVVFAALARVRNADVVPVHEQLAAHATRMGFPDIDWGNYLGPGRPDQRDLPENDHEKMAQTIAMLLATQTDTQ